MSHLKSKNNLFVGLTLLGAIMLLLILLEGVARFLWTVGR